MASESEELDTEKNLKINYTEFLFLNLFLKDLLLVSRNICLKH